MVSPLPKAVQTKKQKRISKKSEVLSSSPCKSALLSTRKGPNNNKEGSKTTLRRPFSSVNLFCSCRRIELTVLVVTKPMKDLLLRTGCNVVGVNNDGMKTVQVTKAWDSSNVTYANAHSYR
jgi:hypothetical protein